MPMRQRLICVFEVAIADQNDSRECATGRVISIGGRQAKFDHSSLMLQKISLSEHLPLVSEVCVSEGIPTLVSRGFAVAASN